MDRCAYRSRNTDALVGVADSSTSWPKTLGQRSSLRSSLGAWDGHAGAAPVRAGSRANHR